MKRKSWNMKKLITNSLSVFLAGLMIWVPVVVLPQSSQNIPTQEEIADTLVVVNDLIDTLESLRPKADGSYTLELDGSSQNAGLLGLFGFMYLRGNKQNDLRLQAELRRQRELRGEIAEVDKKIEETRRNSEIAQERLRENQERLQVQQQRLYGPNPDNIAQWQQQQSGQIWEYKNERWNRNSEKFREMDIGYSTESEIIYSKKIRALENQLADFARRHHLVIHPEFHLSVHQTSRYGRKISLDSHRTFINIMDPRRPSVSIDKKSLGQIFRGEAFSLQGLFGRADGAAIAEQMRQALFRIGIFSSSPDSEILKVSVLKVRVKRWVRRSLLLGLLGGGLYWFFSDDESEGENSLSDIIYRMDLPLEDFEGLLNQFYEERENLKNLQSPTNNESGFLNF